MPVSADSNVPTSSPVAVRDLFHGPCPWESPEVGGLGRLPMRSPLATWPEAELARRAARLGPAGAGMANPFVLSLDGRWKFALAENPAATPANFDHPDFDDAAWSEIDVPGTWSLQGFDRPHYTNVVMPFGNVPPSTPVSHNPTGLYRLWFDLPSEWTGRRVVLHVGGAESFLEVSCNGARLGFSKDTRLPSEFDLGPALKAGRNLLALRVIRYSDSSFVEDQDQWWFGGVHRGVHLYSTSGSYFADMAATPVLSGDLSKGRVDVTAILGFSFDPAADAVPFGTAPVDYGARSIGAEHDAGGDWLVRLALYGSRVLGAEEPDDSPETPIAQAEVAVGAYYRQSRWEGRASFSVEAPELWSDESPALYCLVATLVSPSGREEGHVACRVGFRRIEVRDRKLLVNGRRVMIRGVNRHEHDEWRGKTLDLAGMLEDIRLLKRHNFNAVRLSHYPNDERWYELCDEFGLYLFDEADIESHAYYDHLCRDPRWATTFLERGMRMVLRDRNHPSVIVWSLGNESGYGPNHEALAAWIRAFDPTRPLHYEGAFRPEWGQGPHDLESLKRGRGVSDIVSTMYSPIELLEAWDAGTDDDRPFILCEFSHAMGNSNGSLSDYWAAIEKGRGLQGGFIWDWVDQGLAAFDDKGAKYWKYGGDFGDEPSDLDFVCNGLVFADRSPKPVLAECAWLFRQLRASSDHPMTGMIRLRSLANFVPIKHVDLAWRLLVEGETRLSGRLPVPELAPASELLLDLGIPWTDELRELVALSESSLLIEFVLAEELAWAPAGHRLGWDQLPLSPATVPRRLRAGRWRPEAGPGDRLPLRTPSGGWSFESRGSGEVPAWSAAISPAGFLTSMETEGRPLIRAELAMNLWRVPTENDGLRLFMDRRGTKDFAFYYENKAMYAWLDAGLDSLSFDSPSAAVENGLLRLTLEARTRTGKRAGRLIEEFRFDDGGMDLFFVFDIDSSLPELPRIGLAGRLAEGLENVRWHGLGPQENYPDRRAGAILAVHESKVDGLGIPYVFPQENGNRGGTRWLEVSDGNRGLRFEGEGEFHFGLSHHDPADLWRARHTCELERRPESFLTIDVAQRGLGTATCGPDTLERYRVMPGVYWLRLRLTPFRSR